MTHGEDDRFDVVVGLCISAPTRCLYFFSGEGASGYEWVDGRLRLYVDGPNPEASFARDRGVRTPLFHLYDGIEAEAVRGWLAANRVWQFLRVSPPFSRGRVARAILIAGDWHGGEASAVYRLSISRMIRNEAQRERPLREVRATTESVLENPVSGDEFVPLQLLLNRRL